MARGGGAAGVAARTPVLDAVERVFSVELFLPHQLPLRRGGPIGPRALLARLLFYALIEAELGPSARRPLRGRTALARWRRHVRPAERQLARQWLLGELDDQGVTVPIGWLCDQLGLEASALAAAVRRSAGTDGRRHERVTTNERRRERTDTSSVRRDAPAPARRHARADGAESRQAGTAATSGGATSGATQSSRQARGGTSARGDARQRARMPPPHHPGGRVLPGRAGAASRRPAPFA